MTDFSHDNLGDVFLIACDLSGAERKEYLDKSCSGNSEMRAQVERMLQADEAQPSGLSQASMNVDLHALFEENNMPAQIGPYTIKRRVGVGGMGIVFEAEQEKPNRSVALKVLRWVEDPRQIARFELEAEVLGWLQHPAIAHIHGAGQSDLPNGPRPWIAMEFVDGVPIDQFVEQHSLSEKATLLLLERVLDGIAHAHSKGVVHRDLKPANILVDQSGAPRIVDFGVARLATRESETVQTQAGEVIGTLAYMSPEQVGGDPSAVDTQTDIYAMGAIAYELLSGTRAVVPKGSSVTEAMHSIATGKPQSLRSVANTSLDLSTIVHTALARDKAKRYPTAEAFSEDIRRYLANEVILARPPSALYQLRCFGRRNRIASLALAASLALLIGGGGLSTYLYLKEQKANDAKIIALEKADKSNSEALKQAELAEQGLLFYGNIISQVRERNMGRNVPLADLLQTASLSVPKVFHDSPALQIQFLNTFSTAQLSADRKEQALADSELAVQLLGTITTNKPDLASQTYMTHATALGELGQFDEAVAALQKAESSLTDLDDRHQAYLYARVCQGLAIAHNSLGDYQESLTALDQAFEILDRAEYTEDLPGWLLQAKGRALAGLDRLPEAIESTREAIAYMEKTDRSNSPQWIEAKYFLGVFLNEDGAADLALRELLPLPAMEESVNGKSLLWQRILMKINTIYSSQAKHRKIIETFERALQSEGFPESTTPFEEFQIWNALGMAYFNTEDFNNAETSLKNSLDALEDQTDANAHTARFTTYNFLSQIARSKGDKEQAVEYASLSCQAGDIPIQPPHHPGKRVLGYRFLAFMHTENDDWKSGAETFLAALELSIARESNSDRTVRKNRVTLVAECKMALSRLDTAPEELVSSLNQIIADQNIKTGQFKSK